MYKITFNDNSTFNGGDFLNSHWDNIPNKPIKRIVYQLFDKTLILQDYDSYNQVFERTISIFQPLYHHRYFYIFAKKDSYVKVFRIHINKKILHTYISEFSTEYDKTPIYDEYGKIIKWIGGRSTTGWKVGVLNQQPKLKWC